MIERVLTALAALASGEPTDALPDRRTLGDYADAIRLELDCLQQELTSDQRSALATLGDLLDDPADPAVVRHAARDARAALGYMC